jgi:hypothetical protein
VYGTIYTRRGTVQHDSFVDACIDQGRYIMLSDELYLIVDREWLPLANAWRWQVRRVEAACA